MSMVILGGGSTCFISGRLRGVLEGGCGLGQQCLACVNSTTSPQKYGSAVNNLSVCIRSVFGPFIVGTVVNFRACTVARIPQITDTKG